MGKLKSHSGAKKRVRATGSGRLAVKRHGRNHLLQQKSKRQKRLSRTLMVHPSNEKTLKSLLPHL
jgi:large subunit ribosomal protein L35